MDFPILIDSLIHNTWFILIIALLAPMGIILTIVFYLKPRQKKSMSHSIISDTLIKDFVQKIDGLEICFSGKQIETLIITKIAFWSNGTETINHGDIPSNDSFSINIDDKFDILDMSVIQITNKANDIKAVLSENNKEVKINFDYLDKDDGFVIQLFHTGNIENINICGSIKGFGKISKGHIGPISTLKKLLIILFFENILLFFTGLSLNKILYFIALFLFYSSIIFFLFIPENIIRMPLKLRKIFRTNNKLKP